MNKIIKNIFFLLVVLSLVAPVLVFKDLLFPFVTSKAFYFRILIEAALPFYVYLIVSQPNLRPVWKKNPLNILMIVFLVFNLVSAYAGVGVVRSLWGNFERMGGVFYLAHLTALYFYVVCLGQMGGKYLKWFLYSFLAVALFITINGIFGKLGLSTIVLDASLGKAVDGGLPPGRVSSTLGNPIYLGSYLIIPLFLSLFLGRQAESKGKAFLYYFIGLLFLIGIFLSGTRGALVGLVLGTFLSAVIYLIFCESKKVKLYGGIAVIAVVAMYVLLSLNNNWLPQGSNISRIFNLKDSNTEARLIQWQTALEGYKHYPLFGVGPENYYIISNQFYKPELYQYDKSWFDKPHNYIIEILATTGIFGFTAYMAMLGFIIWALYKGYKLEFLSLFEFCSLLAALLAYQVQNLTVFDTVPASLTFYAFVGFVGYIYTVSVEQTEQVKAKVVKLKGNTLFAMVSGGVTVVVVAYVLYAANFVPLSIAKSVNYGFAYASVNPEKADEFFQKAVNYPFNFDKTQTAQKYSEFSSGFIRNASAEYQPLAHKVNEEVITALHQALEDEPQYPILWQSLAEAELFKNYQGGVLTSVDPQVYVAINEAIKLAPDREEPFLVLAQIKALAGDIVGAETVLEEQAKKFKTDYSARMQLSNIYRMQNKMDQAVTIALEAKKNGFPFSDYGSIRWIVQYYIKNKDYNKAYELIQELQKIDQNNVASYQDLAITYAGQGKFDIARNLAVNLMNQVTSTAPQMQELIKIIDAEVAARGATTTAQPKLKVK